MRQLIVTAITTAALIAFVGGTAAYAVLDQAHFAAGISGVHNLSVHASHDGRALRPAHVPLFTL
jgi:hypothetical protein